MRSKTRSAVEYSSAIFQRMRTAPTAYGSGKFSHEDRTIDEMGVPAVSLEGFRGKGVESIRAAFEKAVGIEAGPLGLCKPTKRRLRSKTFQHVGFCLNVTFNLLFPN